MEKRKDKKLIKFLERKKLLEVRKKKTQKIEHWLTYKISQNNVFMTATMAGGECLVWRSAGRSGFKGPRRATPYAANVTGGKFFYRFLKKLKKLSRQTKKRTRYYPAFHIGVLIKSGRKRKIKLMMKGFFNKMRKNFKWINSGKMPEMRFKCIIKKNRIAHNGLRKKKKRRV